MDLLPELLKEEFEELRWRRDIEDRLVKWTISICTGILSATIVFTQYADSVLVLIFCIFSAVLSAGFGIIVCFKLEAENEAYKGVGRTIVKILKNKFIMEKDKTGEPNNPNPNIGEDIKKLGEGEGYKNTVAIIKYCTVVTSLGIIALGLANFLIVPIKKILIKCCETWLF
jgi:hypothetical protein